MECDFCYGEIGLGAEFLQFDDLHFCSEDCLENYIEDNVGVFIYCGDGTPEEQEENYQRGY